MEETITSVALQAREVDFSILGMFLGADAVVKTVILILLGASIGCWAIIFDKFRRIRKVRAQAEEFEEMFWSGGALDDLAERIGQSPDHPMAVLFLSAMREWRRSEGQSDRGSGSWAIGIHERLDKVMQVTISREMERLERNLGFLATVGSTAPFVGLFGTVWGIMDSFQAIAASHNTSLAVVAPGIAQALFATALGLVAAIPAVVAYNKFANDTGRFAGQLESFADEFSAFLSRQLSERS